MTRRRGFSLIEVMIAVAIIAILGAVAYPSYMDYLKKGRRGAAQTFMMEVANRQSQYLLDTRGYAVNLSDLSSSNVLNIITPSDVSPYYTVKVDPTAATTPPTYTIVATPKSGTAQANDGVLTLDHTGAKFRGTVAGW
jgi:type IV pilus assembly protein PilE